LRNIILCEDRLFRFLGFFLTKSLLFVEVGKETVERKKYACL
jgi:hypothetical protein